MTGEAESLTVDYLVLATGFNYTALPPPLAPLNDFALHDESDLLIEQDYRLRCKEDFKPDIYLQGFAEHTHGIAETALSLTAYRAGVIAESVAERLRGAQDISSGPKTPFDGTVFSPTDSAEAPGNGKTADPKVRGEEHVP